MADIALFWFDFGGGVKIESGDLLSDSGLTTSILLSLFVDGRASNDELPDGETDYRGHWTDSDADRHGSLLWTLRREKITPEVILKAKGYTEKALQWIIDDGIASAVNVTVSRAGLTGIAIKIKITKSADKAYSYLWEGQENSSLSINNTSFEIEFE